MSHTHIYCKRQTDFNFARVRQIFIYYDFKSYPPVSLERSCSGDTCDKSYKLLYTYLSHVITWCHVIQVTWLAVVQSIPSVKNKPKLELHFLSFKKYNATMTHILYMIYIWFISMTKQFCIKSSKNSIFNCCIKFACTILWKFPSEDWDSRVFYSIKTSFVQIESWN